MTRREAESAAAVRLEEVGHERARLRADAEAEAQETRETGDVYATQRRQAADRDAEQVLADAERQARAIREAAEAMADQLENDALARAGELSERGRELETRLGRVPAALRATAEQLEAALANGRSPDSLLDALDVERHKAPSS